jgi:hypothetical protein
MLKLGTNVTDTVTGIKGMLTHYDIDMGRNVHYMFQPGQLSPEDGQPVESFWINENRIEGGILKDVNLPLEVLGTQVEDIATGFKGTAIALRLHINGCVHFQVKPKGVIEKTGKSIGYTDFDIRRLKGDAIKQLSEEEIEKSERTHPSPADCPPLSMR